MSNINRDYTIVLDVKSSTFTAPNIYFYNTDVNTSNIYVQLVIKETLLNVTPIDNATDYKIKVSIIKPNNVVKVVNGTLVNEERSIFEFDLPEDCTNVSGIYKLEFDVSCIVSERPENITTFPARYEVKKSILTDFVPEITDTEDNTMMKDFLAQLEGKFDDVRVNEEETGQTQISLDFYSNGVKIKNIKFACGGGGNEGVGTAQVDYSRIMTDGDEAIPPVYLENGNYNTTIWETGDIISKAKMNKIEQGIYGNREDINKILKAVDKPPTFTNPSLSISLNRSTIEHNVSTNITITPTFRQNDAGAITRYTLAKGNTSLVDTTTTQSYTDTVNISHGTSVTYTATAYYSDGASKTSTFGIEYPGISAGSINATNTVRAYANSYYGVINGNSVTDVAGLTSRLGTSRGYTATYNLTNQRSVYMYPKSFGALTSIKDSNNFEYINSYTRSTATFNNVDYYVYILTDPVTITGFKQIFN